MTFDNVADFGPGVLQPAVAIVVLDRTLGRPPYADVQPGQTVPGGSLIINDDLQHPRLGRRRGLLEGRRLDARL